MNRRTLAGFILLTLFLITFGFNQFNNGGSVFTIKNITGGLAMLSGFCFLAGFFKIPPRSS